jgi:hypothetical protein
VTRALTLLLIAQSASAAPHATHRADQRVAYIKAAIEALRATPKDALALEDDYAHAMSRSACASSIQRLKVECMSTAARRYCAQRDDAQRRQCQASLDVVVSNVLGDNQLISSDKRYQLMRRFKDYRPELARELRRVQGALAFDFHLRMGDTDDDLVNATNIDRYCLATADDTNLAWQTCVSSLLWFMREASEP